MKKKHSALSGFGLAGLATGVVLTAVGVLGADDIAGMAGGYGIMVIGAAVYLLAGLKLRERLGRRAPSIAKASSPSNSAAISARS